MATETTVWASSLGKEWRGVNFQVQAKDKLAWMLAHLNPELPGGKPIHALATNEDVSLQPRAAGGKAYYWTKRAVFAYNQKVQAVAVGEQLGDPNTETTGQCNVELARLMMPVEIEDLFVGEGGLGGLQEGGEMWNDRSASVDMVFTLRLGSCLRYGKIFPLAIVRENCTTSTTVKVYNCNELRAAKNIKVDCIDPAAGTARATGGDSNTITAIDYDKCELTMTSSTFVAGDYIVPEDSYNRGFYGLLDYLSDGSAIGDTSQDYYIHPGTSTWGGLTRSTYGSDYSTLIHRNSPSGALRDWGHDQIDQILTQRVQAYGDDGHPINVFYMTLDTFSYMWKHRADSFYGADFIRQLNADEMEKYVFGYKAKGVYYHPALADGGATIVVDDRAIPHTILMLAMYNDDSDVLGTRWAVPPRWVPNGNPNDKSIENYLVNLTNYTGYPKWRGTMKTVMGLVGNKPNAHAILTDLLGAYNEGWMEVG